jgi:hypothetical protein
MGVVEIGECSGKGRFPKPKGIDSAEWFNQGNYRGKIREVHLGSPSVSGSDLSLLFDEVLSKGYSLNNVGIVNVSRYGGSQNNEPTAAIFLRGHNPPDRDDAREAIIVRNYQPDEWRFYEKPNFRFML